MHIIFLLLIVMNRSLCCNTKFFLSAFQ